jgi:hypothetical protein
MNFNPLSGGELHTGTSVEGSRKTLSFFYYITNIHNRFSSGKVNIRSFIRITGWKRLDQEFNPNN